MSSISRRQFMQTTMLAGAVLAVVPGCSSLPGAKRKKLGIGVQLYSVRDDCQKNFDNALAQVAQMGFEGVEFAGYYNYQDKPAELRKKLDDLNLKGFSTHVGMNNLHAENLKRVIEFHQTVGCKFLIVPGDGDFTNPEKSKTLAETFNRAAEVLKPLGMGCGYHNHEHEFEKDGDKTYWDLFAERTTPDVVLEQDCGWTAAAGLVPADLVRRYPGRTKLTHFKPTVVGGDKTKKAIFGQDSVDWVSTLAACREVGGTEWLIIEQEYYPDGKSPMECTRESLAGLRKIL